MRAIAFSAFGLVALSLHGCGGGTSSGGGATTTSIKPVATTTTTSAESWPLPYTTAAPVAGKTPLYIVMRMDDVNPVDKDDVLAAVTKWFLKKKVKFNFGIIVGKDPNDEWSPYWPNCQKNPADQYCNSATVKVVNDAYDNGDIVGTGPEAVLEMGSHSYGHEHWPTHMTVDEQAEDFGKSMDILHAQYPKASIKFFAPPENVANSDTLVQMQKYNLSIISAAATWSCGAGTDPKAGWYLTSPCMDTDLKPKCQPEKDIWATTEGFARVGGITSAPAGSANSMWTGGGQQGITVEQAVGEGDCGCKTTGSGGSQRVWCSIIASATSNAAKSNGLHWTVHMMHPQTVFPDHDKYTAWLDAFYEKLMGLKEWDVRFINYQDLVNLPAPATGSVTSV